MTAVEERSGSSTGTGGFDHRLIAPMILGSILNPINSSMLAVALVPIGKAFGAPPSETIWLVSALYLATAVGQPVVGRLVDRYGPRTLYLLGTALVGIAGVLGAVAPGLGVLILSRVLLGFGTSAAYPASMFLLRSESERTGLQSPAGVLAMLSIANQVMAVVGPTLGGALIGVGGWHLIFTINVPLSLACLALGRMSLPKSAELPASVRARQGGGVDITGMVLFAGTLVVSMLFLMKPTVAHWYLLVLAGVVGTGFVLRELRAAQPFIDLRVLGGNAPLLATYGRQVLAFVTAYAFLYGFTQWLEEGRSLSASVAGLVLLPMSLSAIAITAVTGRRRQVRGKLVAGALLQVAACACLLLLGPHTGIWLLVVVGVLSGLPQGLNGLANQNALYHQADPARMASSAGLLRTGTYLGALIAAAADAAVFPHVADSAGVHELALLLLVVSLLLVILTLTDRSLGRVGRDSA
ncbi:MFS transporter [Nocardia vinacea]|uniref:MFS transporter n=1 Tax=Nocardia vinacea TaxID=96468 RepID=UPI0033CE8E42